jgi:hypothetical protein
VHGAEALATHILHAYMPLAYLFIWFFHLRNATLEYTDSIKWLSVPAAYFIYLMIRGELIGKYPYFFVDVQRFGILTVLLYACAILIFFFLVGSTLVFVDRRSTRQSR